MGEKLNIVMGSLIIMVFFFGSLFLMYRAGENQKFEDVTYAFDECHVKLAQKCDCQVDTTDGEHIIWFRIEPEEYWTSEEIHYWYYVDDGINESPNISIWDNGYEVVYHQAEVEGD